MSLDARKRLSVLRDEWEDCKKCNLGEVRIGTGGAFVFGEGTPGGLMFIGEGPDREENEEGRPFVGASGRFFRTILEQIGIKNYYITNTVCCRSFEYQYNADGQQRYINRRGVQIPAEHDAPPTPVQQVACTPRLHEEIYLVDPVLIVTLGVTSAKAVLGRAVPNLQEAGELQPEVADKPGTILRLPGARKAAKLTPKGTWRRRSKGAYHMPVETNYVEYPVIPLLHPSFVLRNRADQSIGSPKDCFARGLTNVKRIYSAYLRTVFNDSNSAETVSVDQLDAVLDVEDEA